MRKGSPMEESTGEERLSMPDNAEQSVKCRQCGYMITVGSPSAEEMVTCPVCGAMMNAADLLDTSTSNEGY